MNFFQTLNEQFPDADLSIRIKCKNGMLTISVMPHTEGETNIQPLIVTGSAEELDKGFFGVVVAPLKETTAALVNLEQHRESVKAASKEAEKETKPAPSKSKPDTKKDTKKSSVKKETSAPTEGSLFEELETDITDDESTKSDDNHIDEPIEE